jgi:hypothetical protein
MHQHLRPSVATKSHSSMAARFALNHVATLRGHKSLPTCVAFVAPDENASDDIAADPRIITLQPPADIRNARAFAEFGMGMPMLPGPTGTGAGDAVVRLWTRMTAVEMAKKRSLFREPERYRYDEFTAFKTGAPGAFDVSALAATADERHLVFTHARAGIFSLVLVEADGFALVRQVDVSHLLPARAPTQFAELHRSQVAGVLLDPSPTNSLLAVASLSSSGPVVSIDFGVHSEDDGESDGDDEPASVLFTRPTRGVPNMYRDSTTQKVSSVRISPDGRRVAVAAMDSVTILDIQAGEVLHKLRWVVPTPEPEPDPGDEDEWYDTMPSWSVRPELRSVVWLSEQLWITGWSGSFMWSPDDTNVPALSEDDMDSSFGPGFEINMGRSGEFGVVGESILDPLDRQHVARLSDLGWEESKQRSFISCPVTEPKSNVAISNGGELIAASSDETRLSVLVFRHASGRMTKAAGKR